MAALYVILMRFYSKLRMGKGPYLSREQFTPSDASALGFLQHACSRTLHTKAGRVLLVGCYAS